MHGGGPGLERALDAPDEETPVGLARAEIRQADAGMADARAVGPGLRMIVARRALEELRVAAPAAPVITSTP